MHIAKKAALLAATAGTLTLLGTGATAANAYGGGSDRSSEVPTSVDISTFIFQKNDCDTRNGQAFSTGALGPSGDIKIGSTCLNNIGG